MAQELTEDQRAAKRAKNTEYQRAWRSKNREKSRSYNRGPKQRNRMLKSRYGISLEAATEMLAAQGGGCAICGDASAFHVDHCHTSGAVRGILCNGCNTGLGLFKEDPARLIAATQYLEKSNAAAADIRH
jgi:hypothetical protein